MFNGTYRYMLKCKVVTYEVIELDLDELVRFLFPQTQV